MEKKQLAFVSLFFLFLDGVLMVVTTSAWKALTIKQKEKVNEYTRQAPILASILFLSFSQGKVGRGLSSMKHWVARRMNMKYEMKITCVGMGRRG